MNKDTKKTKDEMWFDVLAENNHAVASAETLDKENPALLEQAQQLRKSIIRLNNKEQKNQTWDDFDETASKNKLIARLKSAQILPQNPQNQHSPQTLYSDSFLRYAAADDSFNSQGNKLVSHKGDWTLRFFYDENSAEEHITGAIELEVDDDRFQQWQGMTVSLSIGDKVIFKEILDNRCIYKDDLCFSDFDQSLPININWEKVPPQSDN